MAVNTESLIATREFAIFVDDWDPANAMPADTVLYGTTPAGYTDLGGTSGGLSFGVDISRTSLRLDQLFFDVATPVDEVSITMGAELAEITPATLRRVTGLGTLTTLPADATTRGHDTLVIDADFEEQTQTVLARIKKRDNEVMNLMLVKANNTTAIDMTIEANTLATMGAEWTGLYESEGDRIFIMHSVLPIDPDA